MSVAVETRALTPPEIAARKGKDRIACLTAYTTPVAQLVNRHCDIVLAGDSSGNGASRSTVNAEGHARHDDHARQGGAPRP